ncbi:MAG: CHAP domain-containing protein [Spirochaetes bacterium]|nr:CHAP domain-containing protein [Spirochaetota bacterium]
METRRKIVDGGLSLVGKTKLVVHGRTYSNDCTGVVLASYAFGNIDLSLHFPKHSGNGVRRIFYTLDDENLLYRVEYPVAGDVIFWDNTYDANGNGLVDDEFTHVGLVVDVAADGLISYLHHHYRLGPVVEYMNLLLPESDFDETGRRINSALRMRGLGGDIGTNAAQVFKIFGQGWRLPPTIESTPAVPE